MLNRWRKLDRQDDIRKQKEVAADYTLKNGKDLHEALTVPAKFDLQRAEFAPLTVVSDLQEVLDVHNATAEVALRFNVKQCTFNDVLGELDAAVTVYKQKATGTSNVIRRIARAAGDYSVEISPWCDLVPADNGLNVLSAGLKMIFGIARRNADNREKILQAFQDIPTLIVTTAKKQSRFHFARHIRQSAITFYETVIRALAELIILLNGDINSKHQFWDRVSQLRKRLFGSSIRGKNIDTILATVSTQAGKFQECLELIRDDIRLDTYGAAVSNSASLQEIMAKIDQLQSEMEGLKERGQQNKDTGPDPALQRQLSTETVDLTWKYGGISRKDQLGLDVMNRVVVFLVSSPFEVLSNSQHSSPVQSPAQWLSETDLMQSLGVYFREHLEDLDTVLKEQHQFDDATQSHARQLLQTPRFSRWISSQSPDMLWVNGNFEDLGPGRLSALSVLCALLVLSLHQNSNAITLHHFCGLHETGTEGTVTGPNGLIRSLIFQLLFCSGHKFNLDFINTRQFANDIESHSLRMLCHTFRQLIEQLPPRQTVICIIDGITGFEYGPWLDDLWDVMLILNKLVTDDALRPNFKLLVTTPFADGIVDRTIGEHQRLVLQSDSLYDGGLEMSDRLVWDDIGQADRLEEYRRAVRMAEQDEDESDGFSE
ncbi:uncharacterized protein DSM5745_00713 [Aspergillus mulundensis]|uniref:Nephrocystin 3-like N-terminal domain-containing protein n=1 Tax=Aspergillus mulundensis TaxID=1810919 RepID=A0A3D8T4K2_9EURO|nr:Uncharacterized protein DSM5745_00713 [Aspergillus mulundensis]RDW93391.1 Uncharacterized protein DSM5745_00713 [Aspergillus mulundensis]